MKCSINQWRSAKQGKSCSLGASAAYALCCNQRTGSPAGRLGGQSYLPLQPTGFWSYTSTDDRMSDGRLSQLRLLLANRLQTRIGRETVYLFQDVVAIPTGTDWQHQLETALAKASFLVPILTPGFLQRPWCMREIRRFRETMTVRGRDDLILRIHYLETLQWKDFRALSEADPNTPAVGVALAGMANEIVNVLYRSVPVEVPGVVPPLRSCWRGRISFIGR